MTNPMNKAIELLQELCVLHEHMFQLAEKLEWSKISQPWFLAETKLDELRKISLVDLSESDRHQATELIETLLTLQNKISERAVPWMEQVRPLLDSFDKHPLKRE